MTILKGFGFSGYRSIGDEIVKIAPLKKINFIIGQNNTGKSNIVSFLHEEYGFWTAKARGGYTQYTRAKTRNLRKTDSHLTDTEVVKRIAFPIFDWEVRDYIEQYIKEDRYITNNRLRNSLENKKYTEKFKDLKKLLDTFADENGDFWFVYVGKDQDKLELDLDIDEKVGLLTPDEWNRLEGTLGQRQGVRSTKYIANDVISRIAFSLRQELDITVISATRKIGMAGGEVKGYSGEGIIERLAETQNPPLDKRELTQKFESINQFIQDVLENSTAEIEVPNNKDMILVHMDGKTLPLESLGTGIHEVIILATASRLLENTVVCIEEPELHLHPSLQRKLVRYLAGETSNQYILTTHSAHMLDAVDDEVSISHVTLQDGASKVESITSNKKRFSVCYDLGYKASRHQIFCKPTVLFG